MTVFAVITASSICSSIAAHSSGREDLPISVLMSVCILFDRDSCFIIQWMCLPKQDDGLIFQFEIKTQLILNFGIDLSRVDLALLIFFC